MDDLITVTFFAILAAGFFVGIVVGLTGMGGGALMTPALIFLGVGDAATVVTADLTAAAVYKTGGAIVHHREGSPNFDAGQVADHRLGADGAARALPRRRGSPTPDELDDVLKMCIGFALLLRRRDLRPAPLHQPAPGARRRHPTATTNPHDPADPDPAGRRARRPAGRHHQRRLRLGDHDRAADALPRPVGGEAGRHRPGAGRPAGAGRRDLQHRAARPRLGDPDPAGHRLGARARSSAARSPRGCRSRSSAAASWSC